ncbi:MAG: hypothetical protein JSW47_07320 [Phycisphaerales bacterium]|nr:MAG: hypothetical protein JSW47_07320 [Phycisphaerales bacterium]
MATISKSWGSEDTIMNAVSVADGSWSSDVNLETNGYEGAHVTVDADFPSNPTDNLIVEVRGSLDGVNYDDTPLFSLTVDKNPDPNQVSFVVKDIAHFKLYCKRGGSTDTITVTAKVQPWRYQST